MSTPVGFGTAGLRAPMGAGPGRFNTELVVRATAGLAMYLKDRQVEGPVLVGFDARHGSAGFAADAAAVLAGAGLSVAIMPRALPTPVLAFAVRHLGAAAGVMITASHNPAADNGYKVYLADGAQIAPPDDAAVEEAMAAAPAATVVPRGTAVSEVAEAVIDAYLTRAVGLLEPGGPRALRVVYTPLHGVAAATFRRAWARAGFEALAEVTEQAEPDPDFPTVAFPNPEEPGALDLAAALAAQVSADLVLAHDPDGDRCAVLVTTSTAPGNWQGRALTGDEVGALLAEHLLSHGRLPAGGVLATTIVSSPQLAQVAAVYGRAHVETLTGFKWLARVPDVAYAYEEALGYCADPGGVRDKDGITAALLVAELAAECRARGEQLIDRLDQLARRDGLVVGAARSIRTPDPAAAAAAVAALLAAPPAVLGGVRVDAVEDLGNPATGLPATTGVRLRGPGLRAVVRPSGTEPKLKIYLHAWCDPPVPDLELERARLAAALAVAADELTTRLS